MRLHKWIQQPDEPIKFSWHLSSSDQYVLHVWVCNQCGTRLTAPSNETLEVANARTTIPADCDLMLLRAIHNS